MMIRFALAGAILSLLVQRKYPKKARPDEAFSQRSDVIVRAPPTHIHVRIGVDTVPCIDLIRPDRTMTSMLAGFIRGKRPF